MHPVKSCGEYNLNSENFEFLKKLTYYDVMSGISDSIIKLQFLKHTCPVSTRRMEDTDG